MRVLVISDTHGDQLKLRQVIDSQPEAGIIFHLGDGIREAYDLAAKYPGREFCIVRGNCDFGWPLCHDAAMKNVDNHKIFCTHGHRYQVKMGLEPVIRAARERGADILLFGHTHQPFCEYRDGLYIFNPGSLGKNRFSYGYIDITPSGIVPQIVELRR